jgi:SET domain-containing protein
MNDILKNAKYLGVTLDNVSRPVDVYADEINMYAVYEFDENSQHVAVQNIKDIKANEDQYLFTPYIEFVHDV